MLYIVILFLFTCEYRERERGRFLYLYVFDVVYSCYLLYCFIVYITICIRVVNVLKLRCTSLNFLLLVSLSV